MSKRYQPKAGDAVELHYGRQWRAWIGRHLQRGVVLCEPGPGAGPRNYLVQLDGEALPIVVPRGQLYPARGKRPARQLQLF